MWSCVPCEVLRQCSATNPADIIIFHACIDIAVCKPMRILYLCVCRLKSAVSK